MTPLARAVYEVLRQRVPSRNGQISYSSLSSQLPPPFTGIDYHFGLSAPLGEIVHACTARGLPPLSALVVRADVGYPGDLYFTTAYPGTEEGEAMRRWAVDFKSAKSTSYPPTLW